MKIIDPSVCGVYTEDPSNLCTSAAFKKQSYCRSLEKPRTLLKMQLFDLENLDILVQLDGDGEPSEDNLDGGFGDSAMTHEFEEDEKH